MRHCPTLKNWALELLAETLRTNGTVGRMMRDILRTLKAPPNEGRRPLADLVLVVQLAPNAPSRERTRRAYSRWCSDASLERSSWRCWKAARTTVKWSDSIWFGCRPELGEARPGAGTASQGGAGADGHELCSDVRFNKQGCATELRGW